MDVYPLPSETIVISDTDPFSIVAIAVAGIPQDSDGDAIVTVGAEVYPDPPFVIEIFWLIDIIHQSKQLVHQRVLPLLFLLFHQKHKNVLE